LSARESKFLHALVDVGARLGVSALAAYRDREPEFGPGTRRGVACLVGGGSDHPPLGKVLGPIPVPNNGTNEMVTVMDGTSAGMIVYEVSSGPPPKPVLTRSPSRSHSPTWSPAG